MKAEEQLLALCESCMITVALAESCTGGACSAHLTRVAGASKYFRGSIISYSNDVKTQVLQVPEVLLEKHGAVSQPVAIKMLEGVFHLMSSDFAIAITGLAGPSGGTDEQPVGTVYIAVGEKGFAPTVFHHLLAGTREDVIDKAVDEALKALIEVIEISRM